MYIVKSLKVAEADIAEACEWYEKQQKGLSLRFVNEIRRLSALLAKDPYIYSVRFSESLRFVNLRKFPYFIAYHIDEPTHTVYLNAVFHSNRDPKSFKSQ